MNVEPADLRPIVTGAIRKASQATGADFRYLLATAQVESNLNPSAAPRTSTARGLFQFVEQTWLAVMKGQGEALGYGRYAGAIEKRASGEYDVSNPRLRQAIMNLRSDPAANATMAGAFTQSNTSKLGNALGRAPSEGELYVAHFLGPAGAERLIGLAQSAPQTSAAAAFPSAARANRSIFFDPQGRSRSVADVLQNLVGRYHAARSPATAVTEIAKALPGTFGPGMPPKDATKAPVVPDRPTVLPEQRYRLGDNGGSAFHGLYRSGPRPEAVSPLVSTLWGAPTRPVDPSSRSAEATPPEVPEAAPAPLDLFSDKPADARALFRGSF